MTTSFDFVFPGQGSQSLNMMAGFPDSAEVQSTFAEASSVLGFDLWKMQHNCQSSAVSHCKCFLKQDVALIVFNAAFSRFAFAAMLFCCFRWSFKMFWLGP